MRGVFVAASFLTRLRLPALAGGAEVGTSVRWFPLVGALLGGTGAALAWILRDLFAMPSTLTATILVALGAWVTGAIHLDGLADTADGFGGGHTRGEVLRIMRDPVVGAYGAIALVLVLTMKVAALTELLTRGSALPFMVAAPALSRWTIAALAAWLPYARADGGLGRAVTDERTAPGLLLSTITAAAIAVAALRFQAVVPIAVAVLATCWIGRLGLRRIGGVTGDVFGASVELTETAVLVSAVLITGC